jgi:hypothetical protein
MVTITIDIYVSLKSQSLWGPGFLLNSSLGEVSPYNTAIKIKTYPIIVTQANPQLDSNSQPNILLAALEYLQNFSHY